MSGSSWRFGLVSRLISAAASASRGDPRERRRSGAQENAGQDDEDVAACPVPSANVYITKNGLRGQPYPEEGEIQMMDHERTEKELQEIFDEIQHSYKVSVEDAFALQERTLDLVRTLLESSEKARGAEGTLEELALQASHQREEFERLVRKSNEAYARVLNTPTDEHHHKVEEAKADLEEASPS